MNLTAAERLMALGAGLYLLGIEIDGDYEYMESLYNKGKTLSSPEMIRASQLLSHHCIRFTRLEDQYLSLQKEMENTGDVQD